MRVTITEIVDGVSSPELEIVSIENRDFSVATFCVMQDLAATCGARFACDVMIEWLTHTGNVDFTVERYENTEGQTKHVIKYVWKYEA